MTYTLNEVNLGCLLHDVGKFMQRAFGSLEDAVGQTYDLESTLCPNFKGIYTHKHVLFTNAFFDLIRKEGLSFPNEINIENVEHVASYHHNPDTCPSPAAAWLCTMADRYSAGMDRREDEETSSRMRSNTAYREIPLKCIFDELILDTKALGYPGSHMYSLCALDPNDAEALIPQEWPQDGRATDLPYRYQALWEAFWKEFKALGRKGSNLSPKLFESALLGLLERYTWAIPSSTVDSPDISLFDHARTTAAIASCLYLHHKTTRQLDSEASIKNKEALKFRLLGGDLSGIQSTLFTLRTQGVKGVNKILRARSFLVGAIAEAATLKIIESFELPLSTILQQAGGRFLLLLPELDGIEEIVDDLREKFDAWLLENYTGGLALNLALSPAFPGASFQPQGFRRIMTQLGQHIEDAKLRPLSKCKQGVLKREFPLDAACSACGVRPAERFADDSDHCQTCYKELAVGKQLIRGNFIFWGAQLPEKWKPIDVLELDLTLLEKHPEEIPDKCISVYRISNVESTMPWSIRSLANHIPLFKDSYEVQDPRYGGIRDEDGEARPGLPKSFQHIAAHALELHENGEYRGKAFLALLKADVDYLGFLFNYGLKRHKSEEDRFTISRIAQLSRMLDLYFTGYLKGVLHRNFPDTYTVYAGGDDLLLIGPWRQTLELASEINKTFRAYTAHNPNITISAGVTLLKPNFPVNRAVREAEMFLEAAKDADRNHICALLERPLTWERYAQRLEDAEWIHERMHDDSPVSTGFIYRILEIAQEAVDFLAGGKMEKAGWSAKLAYHLARNITAQNSKEKEMKIIQWLERLGLDDQFKMTSEHANIFDWFLPIAIALYRNRT